MNADEMNDEASELRWPQQGDRLFVESAWASDAQIVRDPNERFHRMSIGYKRAGDLLVDQARMDVIDRRNVIYPALFCYRQSLELFLKWIVDDFGPNDVTQDLKTHRLDRLWASFVRIADERSTREAEGLLEVETLINEMHKADQMSDGFRYPHGRNRMPFTFGDRGIDLDNLRLVMQGLANFFECTHTALSEAGSCASA